MADIAGSYYSNSSYYPKFTYNISYSQTGRSGSAVSYRFNVSFSRSAQWYGYDIQINWNIGGATGSKQIKGTADAASGSTSFDVTCSTNAAGGTLGAKIWTTSNTDGTHWQNSINTGDRTVNKSTFNTPPSISGSVTAGGTTGNKTIPENTSTIAVSWPAASDSNNNLSGYRLRVSINGGGYTEIARTGAGTRSYNHNVSSYGEGASFKYVVDAYDSYSEWSGNIYSGTLTKNRFSQSTISTSSSIKYSEGNSSVSFSVAGGSNTDGSAILSRKLTCSGITVYNNSVSTGSVVVTVFRTGTAPTGPYVKFDDIKNKFSGASYKGTLTFTLTTSNKYTNSKSNSVNMSVNLQTNPNAVPSCSIVEGAASTAYRQVASTKTSYFLPDGSRVIQVTWGKGSGKLGESVTYDIYVAYGSGSWQLVSSNLSSSTTTLNHKVPKQSAKQLIKYKIRTKTGYGSYSDRDTSTKEIHFYNPPGLSKGTVTRGGTTCDVQVTVNSNSSIPNINTVGTWVCYNKGTTTVVVKGNLTQAQTVQTIKLTGLTDAGQYDLKVTYNDDTGFSSSASVIIAIGANSPIFFLNKYGVGVNGVKATPAYPILIKGSIGLTLEGLKSDAGICLHPGDANGALMTIQSGGAMVIGSGESPKAYMGTIANKALEEMYITSDGSIKFVTNCQTIGSRVTSTLDSSGNLTIAGNITSGHNITAKGKLDTPCIEVRTGGTLPYIDFTNDASTDYDMRMELNTDSLMVIRGGALRISDNWLESSGSTGWKNSTYGGGWNMIDTSWIRSWGGKNVYVEKMLRADGGLEVGAGIKVVAQGGDASRWWVRFYDGTQICWGKHVHSAGDINMQTNIANNTVYGGVNINLYYPVTFTTTPSVQISVSTNAYTCCQATGIATNLFTARAWGNYASIPNHLYFFWVAMGRWK